MAKLMFSCFILSVPPPIPVNYCETSFCPAGVVNVGCNPPPLTGGPRCDGINAAQLEVGPAEQQAFLDVFNAERNEIARGARTPSLPTAARMLKLSWDAELATQAGHHGRSCTYIKDTCRNTADFPNVGQVVISVSTLNYSSRTKIDIIRDVLSSATTNRYVDNGEPNVFTNMFGDKASKVGCAMVHDGEFGNDYVTYVCNFSVATIVGQAAYVQGAPASGCQTGTDATYTSLCSEAERP